MINKGGIVLNFKYWLKITIVSIIVIMITIIIASVALVYFINPNKYKPLIIKEIYNAFQINLEIKGDISWKILPKIQLEIHNVNIKNPKIFAYEENFLQINTLYVALNLKSLLKNNFSINEFLIDGGELNLIRENNLKNWNELFKLANKENNKTTKINDDKNNKFKFSIDNIQLSNFLIKYIEHDKKIINKYFIKNFEINSGFLGKFLITDNEIFLKNVVLIVNNILHVNINFNKNEKNNYYGKINIHNFDYPKLANSLDFIPKFKSIKEEALNNITADFLIDGNSEHLNLKEINVNNKSIHLSGNVNVINFSPLLIKNNIALNKLAIDHFINLNGYKFLINSTSINGEITNNNNFYLKEYVKSDDLILNGIDIGEMINKFDDTLSPTKDIHTIVNSIYLSTLINSLQSYVQLMKSKKINLDKISKFDKFETNLTYNNNVLVNKNINLYSKQLFSNGEGNVNFANNQLSYTLNTKLHSDKNKSILDDITFRTYLSGTTDNIKTNTDWPLVLRQVIQYYSKNGLYDINKTVQDETNKAVNQAKEKAQNYINNLFK